MIHFHILELGNSYNPVAYEGRISFKREAIIREMKTGSGTLHV